jgi:anti-sigma factor RsiW
MSCSPFDLKDYYFGELREQDRHAVDLHIAACQQCHEELSALGATQTALLTVREEEPPRRIAFVSDKVFEPRWWQVLWTSGARLGFASAAMLSVAILVHGFETRPVAQRTEPIVAHVQPAAVDESRIEAEVAKRLEAVLLQSEQRQAARIEKVAAQQKEMEFNHKADLVTLGENYSVLQRNIRNVQRGLMTASSERGGQQ